MSFQDSVMSFQDSVMSFQYLVMSFQYLVMSFQDLVVHDSLPRASTRQAVFVCAIWQSDVIYMRQRLYGYL